MDSPFTPQIFFDETGAIATDVSCRRCAYNMRGLREDGRCPECGTPVGRSTYGDLLQFSEPDWVAKLARGINLILWGIGLTIAGALVALAMIALLGVADIVLTLAIVLASGVALWGTWLLTEPDPSRIGEDIYGTARKIVRLTLLVGLVIQFFGIFSEFIELNPAIHAVLLLVIEVGGLLIVAGEFCRLYYFQKMAQRIPDEKLEKRAGFLKWILPTGLLLVSAVPSLISLIVYLSNSDIAAATPAAVKLINRLSCFLGIAGLFYFVFLLVYLRMLYRFRDAFREQAKLARAIWTAPVESTAKAGPGALQNNPEE